MHRAAFEAFQGQQRSNPFRFVDHCALHRPSSMQAQMSPAYPAPLFTSSVLQSILTHPSWRRTKLMINFCISKKGLPPTKPRKNWRKDMTHVCGTRSRVDCTPIPRCNMQRPGQVAPSTQLVTGPQNRDGRANYHLGNPHRWMDG